MGLSGKNTGIMTPAKDPQASRSKTPDNSKFTENFNPNLSDGSPLQKSRNSPAIKSKKSVSKNPNQIVSPRSKIQERKFVVAKKNAKKAAAVVTCKCKEKMSGNLKKCPCIAYENLRASQEEFFRNRSSNEDYHDLGQSKNCIGSKSEEEEKNYTVETFETTDGLEGKSVEGNGSSTIKSSKQDPDEQSNKMGTLKIKRRREKVLEEARNSTPEPGLGRVMHLVSAFERILSIPSSKDSKGREEGDDKEEIKKVMNWALPGLQPKVPESQISATSVSQSEMFFTSEKFGMDSGVSSSLDSSQGSISSTSRTSGGSRRNRRNSSESSGTKFGRSRRKKKQVKITSQQPFKLRTEQRGRCKEEDFLKKVQEIITEEENQRIPIAQGLPWTTDEPESLVKPPVKESTKPIDLKLHSDMRALERAEFDNHLEEEEEMKRLKRECIPRAQPMPYFDRPFLPRRSMKHPTIPREPKLRDPQHKKIKCVSME
ncbi:hypothetical protein HHK36_024251 [Tetracentron sinense]|uniref:TPX2 C-terminal domain-containing protein n=1 Tax=Tetracentron sinense TaxID=13715 RepID=A0A835D6I6_TETSI|nr:hypothetical protein HHK36_024251 [Tetracentron sinense]